MMEKLSVPRNLRHRVMDYYSYLWERHGTFSPQKNLNLGEELSQCLNSELSLFIHRRIVTHVPMFRRSSLRVVQAVVSCLVAEIFITGDFIVRCGSRNQAMYFIRDGRVAVLLDDPEHLGGMLRVNVLRRNGHFGELSLLSDSHKATAHILSETNLDTHVLYKSGTADVAIRALAFVLRHSEGLTRVRSCMDRRTQTSTRSSATSPSSLPTCSQSSSARPTAHNRALTSSQ
jgi:CRP-like cAMP-binding protein